jgi:drug/metabolite transporter (DMT)-like permease
MSLAASRRPDAALALGAGDWLLILLLSVLWGSATLLKKVAVRDIGPVTVVFFRVLLAAILLYGAIRVRGIPLDIGWRHGKPFLVMGFLNSVVPFTLIAWGVIRIDSGVAGILLATTPIFTALLAHVATRDERLCLGKVLGIGLGMVGVLIIMGGNPMAVMNGSGPGKIAILGAAVAYSVSGVYGRSMCDTPAIILAWGQLSASAVLLTPIVLLAERPWESATWSRDAIGAVAALAVLSTVFRYLVFYRLLATVGATNTSLVGFLIPGSSILLGFMFLGERLLATQVAGVVLIATALAVIDGRLPRRAARGRGARRVASEPSPYRLP